MQVLCKNPDCKNNRESVLAPVPVPSRPETIELAYTEWPEDWKADIACLLCGSVSPYEKKDVQAEFARTSIQHVQSTHADISIMFDCPQASCGCFVQFYVRLPGALDSPTLRDILRAGFFFGVCEKGHKYHTNGSEQVFRCGAIRM